MSLTVEQIAEEALSLPSSLSDSLDPLEEGYTRTLWVNESLRRRDDVRNGHVQTITGDEALSRIRQMFSR